MEESFGRGGIVDDSVDYDEVLDDASGLPGGIEEVTESAPLPQQRLQANGSRRPLSGAEAADAASVTAAIVAENARISAAAESARLSAAAADGARSSSMVQEAPRRAAPAPSPPRQRATLAEQQAEASALAAALVADMRPVGGHGGRSPVRALSARKQQLGAVADEGAAQDAEGRRSPSRNQRSGSELGNH